MDEKYTKILIQIRVTPEEVLEIDEFLESKKIPSRKQFFRESINYYLDFNNRIVINDVLRVLLSQHEVGSTSDLQKKVDIIGVLFNKTIYRLKDSTKAEYIKTLIEKAESSKFLNLLEWIQEQYNNFL